MSFAALILIAFIALVVGALLSRGVGRGLALVAALALAFSVMLGLRVSYSYQSEHSRAEIARHEAMQRQQAEMLARAHGQPIPDTNLIQYSAPQVQVGGGAPAAVKLLLLLAVFGLLMLAFAMVRRHRGEGGGRSLGGAVVAIIGLFALGAFLFGWAAMRSVPVMVATTEPVPLAQPADVIAADGQRYVDNVEPHDELWDRLTKGRIPVSSVAEAHAGLAASEEVKTEADHNDDSAPAVEADVAKRTWSNTISRPTEIASKIASEKAKFDEHDHAEAVPATATDPAHLQADGPAEATPRPKPDWVVNPTQFTGAGNGVSRVIVQAGPYSTLKECYKNLRTEMRAALRERISQLVRESTGRSYASVPDIEMMYLGDSYIDRLVKDQYVEDVEASFGLTKTMWAKLEFTSDQDRFLIDSWKHFARRDGIIVAMGVSGLVLGLLGCAFALLKIDTWTRGYYSKRLFLGVPAAIIAVVLFAALINS